MSFPTSPANGDTATVNGITYIYNQANNAWKRQALTSLSITNITATGNAIISGDTTISGNVIAADFTFSNSAPIIAPTYDLDDMSSYTDGYRILFTPRYNGVPVAIAHPNQLTVAVNGALQPAFVQNANTEIVWQSHLFPAYRGYTIDTSGNIKFSEAPGSGSQLYARTTVGSTYSTIKIYPFRPVDIATGL